MAELDIAELFSNGTDRRLEFRGPRVRVMSQKDAVVGVDCSREPFVDGESKDCRSILNAE
jgi:hypothetical protein